MVQRASFNRAVLLITAIGSLLFGACKTEETKTPLWVDFRAPEVLGDNVVDVRRFDADFDGEDEWVVLYLMENINGTGPIGVLVYDSDRGNPPIIYPYKLRMPGQGRLGYYHGDPEKIPTQISKISILTPMDANRPQLMVSSGTELAIIKVNDKPGGPLGQPFDSPDTPVYECIGYFQGNAGVNVITDTQTVEVYTTDPNERSGFIVVKAYKLDPQTNTFFKSLTNQLVDPSEAYLTFPGGRPPANVMESPYPEKIVLSFYLWLPSAPDSAKQLLSKAAAEQLGKKTLNYGSPWPTDKLKRVLVKEIRYYPPGEDSTAATVELTAIFVSEAGTQSPPARIRWNLTRVPEGDKNLWKMDQVTIL
ncbi:MAG: hypothetical protein H5T64_03030 [Chloroflexi bacterium]|nr:hypothetical protein [Chloroflexota bacterium]